MSDYLVVNFDKKQYLAPAAFGERADRKSVLTSYEGVLTGLIVLLADGNNRGGGDLRSNHPIIGSWAGNRIAIVDDAVVDAGLSEPGMQEVPLQRQVLATGKDVSKDVIEAIISGEGDFVTLARLNAKHVLPLVAQRELSSRGQQLLLTAKGRAQPLVYTQDLFEIFGVEAGMTPASMPKRLQKGLTEMAALLGRPERWSVRAMQAHQGSKRVNDEWRRGETKAVTGVQRLDITLVDEASEQEKLLVLGVEFGLQGTTTAQLYDALFPGAALEAVPAIAEGVKSPEVLKLLSMIPGLEG